MFVLLLILVAYPEELAVSKKFVNELRNQVEW